MDTLLLKIPDLLNEKINEYARDKGLSKSEIVRMALDAYFAKTDPERKGSFFDLSKDLAGSVDDPNISNKSI